MVILIMSTLAIQSICSPVNNINIEPRARSNYIKIFIYPSTDLRAPKFVIKYNTFTSREVGIK